MLRDIAGGVWGVLVFALPMLAPGYGIARLARLPAFRNAGLREQLAWTVSLSFGAGTILLVALGWIIGVTATGWALVALSIAALAAFLRNPPRFDITRRTASAFALFAFLWTAVILLSLFDLGLTHRLWMSVTSYDHSVRTAFVGAVMRSGVPPANPLYWPGHAAPMRYYYFWYVT